MSDDDTADTTDTTGDTTGDQAIDPQERITALERQNALERTSFETGVPVELLAQAETPEDMLRLATDAMLWAAETAPQPPPPATAAVSASEVTSGTGVLSAGDRAAMNPRYTQVQTKDAVGRMSPAEVLHAWRSGRLASIGVGAPQPSGSTPLTRRGH